MASTHPHPISVRTATPPPDEYTPGAGMSSPSTPSPTKHYFDPDTLSPMSAHLPTRRFSSKDSVTTSPLAVSTGSPTYNFGYSPSFTSTSTALPEELSPRLANPFKFQTTTLDQAPVGKSIVGQRRGHKYKHSSVSHQIFLEPPPRAPLALPASLPIPSLKECWRSMSREQTTRIVWCFCHAGVAAYTLYSSEGSLAITALSHLILFDALGAMLCVVVDVLCNFDVWKRSSIRHPFGLERAEVLAGFATSIFLLFMGLDLISHNLQHSLEGIGSHESHHAHNHGPRLSAGSLDIAALLAIVATLISAKGLGNHARIGKIMRMESLSSLPSILANPSHFLTLSCSGLLLVLPLLGVEMYVWLDRLISSFVAVSMVILGTSLLKKQASMLLMSFSHSNGASNANSNICKVLQEIRNDPQITKIEEARFWQAHYGLCVANLKVCVNQQGLEDGGVRIRERLAGLVRNSLGGGYGRGGGVSWEVSTQLMVDNM